MTRGIIGKKGAGKSLLALSFMLARLARGGAVASNIDLDPEGVARFCWRRGHEYDPAEQFHLLDLNKRPQFYRECPKAAIPNPPPDDRVMIVVDEAHLAFPAAKHRELAKEFHELHDWNSQCRKVGQELYLVTQAWENIWGPLRRQTEQKYDCRDMRSLKLPLVGNALGGTLGLRWTLRDEETNEPLEFGTTKITKELVACYNTAQVFSDVMGEIFEGMPVFRRNHRPIPLHRRLRKRSPLPTSKIVEPENHQADEEQTEHPPEQCGNS